MFYKSALVFAFILLIVTRLIGIRWGGETNFFNPDENNMASAITRFSSPDLNPHFFAYGQFPLYLTYYSIIATTKIFTGQTIETVSYPQAIYGLRLWSAIFAIVSIFILYKVARLVFENRRIPLIFLYLLIFNPGLIQVAHFGTTESLLILVFVINIYIAIKIIHSTRLKRTAELLLLGGICTGIGLASKISSFIFLGPILLSVLFIFPKSAFKLKLILLTQLSILVSLFLFVIFSPYNLIDHQDFLSTMNYETSVATGKSDVFYTRQFINTPPYIFQLSKIFPYTNGLVVYLFSLFGLSALIFGFKKLSSPQKQIWFCLLISCLVYFLYFGQLYTKWTRFMSPIFFIFPLFASIFIARFRHPRPILLLTVLSSLSGIIFLHQYCIPDVRLTATKYLNSHIPAEKTILSEAGNVVNLPLSGNNSVINFDFYSYDADSKLPRELASKLVDIDYILVPSRRMFKNQTAPQFPYSSKYYQALFQGQLGFIEITKIKPLSDLFLNEENAEETWSVFDRPTVRVFQKIKQQTLLDYQRILL